MKFKIVSEKIPFDRIKSKNIELVEGQWNKSVLTDHEIKEIYSNAALSIIPIKNSYQPSGQSVTLQSLSCGTQVIISDTEGFWDRNNFKNNKNIYFVKENNYKSWSNRINQVLSDEKNLKITQKQGKELVFNMYTLEKFKQKLLEVIELDNNITN